MSWSLRVQLLALGLIERGGGLVGELARFGVLPLVGQVDLQVERDEVVRIGEAREDIPDRVVVVAAVRRTQTARSWPGC